MVDLATALLVATVWTGLEVSLYLGLYAFALGRRRRVTDELVATLGSNEGARERYSRTTGSTEGSLLLMGTIFLPMSFALLVVLASPPVTSLSPWFKTALALGSPLLYSWWLFVVQLSTRVMHDVDADVMIRINDPVSQVLKTLYGETHGDSAMMFLRRNHWLAYLPLLIFPATLYLLSA